MDKIYIIVMCDKIYRIWYCLVFKVDNTMIIINELFVDKKEHSHKYF